MNEIKTLFGDYLIFNELKGVKIALSEKSFGDMGTKEEDNEENRKKFFKQLNIDSYKIVRNRQIHSDLIVKADRNILFDADGLYTDEDSCALYNLTADCYSLAFTTDNGKTFGIVHAGWRGIANGIVEKMRDMFHNASEVLVINGICASHFEVEDDVKAIFEKKYGSDHIAKTGKYLIDLREIINEILKDDAEIFNANICNICNYDKLYSYRMGDADKRNLSIVWRDL